MTLLELSGTNSSDNFINTTKSTFDIDDVKKVIVDLGIEEESKVNQALIDYHREKGMIFANDAVAGIFLIFESVSTTPGNEEIKQRFFKTYGS